MIHTQLKKFFKNQRLTQKELSDITGKSVRTVQYYLDGVRSPDASFLEILLKNFNLNINWLLTGQSEMYIKEEINNFVNDVDVSYKYNELSIEEKAITLDVISIIRKRKNMGRLLQAFIDINRDKRENE